MSSIINVALNLAEPRLSRLGVRQGLLAPGRLLGAALHRASAVSHDLRLYRVGAPVEHQGRGTISCMEAPYPYTPCYFHPKSHVCVSLIM